MTHYTSYNSAVGEFSRQENRAIKGTNIAQMTLQPRKTDGVFLEEARGVVERNRSTCGRSERAISSRCRVQHLSTSRISIWSRARVCLHNLWCAANVPHPATAKEEVCTRVFTQIWGRGNNALGLKGALAVFREWGTNWRARTRFGCTVCTHTQCSVRRQGVTETPQRPCFRLHSAVSPYALSSRPPALARLLLPFVRVIYTTVYAPTTCKPAVPPRKENVM